MPDTQKNNPLKGQNSHAQSDSDRKYQLIAENTADYISIMDFQGIYEYVSPSHRKLGYREEDLLGKCGFDMIPQEDKVKLTPLIAKYAGMKIQQALKLKKEMHSRPISFRFPDSKGKFHYMEATASFINSPDTKGINILMVSRDVTERILMEEQLKESEERYRALIELGTEAGEAIVMIQDIDGREGIQTFVNDHWAIITGYPKKELTGSNFFDLISDSDRQSSIERHRQRMSGKTLSGMFEMNILRKDGTEIPVEFTGAFTTYQGQRANVLYLRDISAHKQYEQKLRQSEEHFSSLYNEVPIAIWDLDYSQTKKYIDELRGKGISDFRRYFDDNPDEILHCLKLEGRRKPYVNKTAARFWEADSMEQLRDGIFSLISKRPAGLSYDKENILCMIEGRNANSYDCCDLTFKGNLKHFHAIWRVAPGHENDWSRIYHLFYDITERKQAEKTLHESEEKFKNLADQSPNIIFIHSGGKIVYVNKKAEKMMGYTREEYYSPEFDFLCLIAPEFHGQMKASFAEHLMGKEVPPIEYKVITKEGKQIETLLSTRLIEYDGQHAILGTITDISERKRNEEAVRLNEARLESLQNISEYRTEDPQKLLNFALSEAIKLTDSKIGLIFNYDETKQEFILNAWSEKAARTGAIDNTQTVYELKHAGLWEEVVRQRRPILMNGYQALSPPERVDSEGPAGILRYLGVPIIIQGHIVAAVGVANRESDYTAADIRQLSLLMDSVWKVVDHMKAEAKIKASLVEKELLLKEIHHRVKNNMQVISSLLELQSGFVINKTDALMFQESQQRINSMSLVYNKLYQSKDLANISFAEYVNSLVARLMESYNLSKDRVTTRIDIGDIEIEIDLAIPCGLIINEVITNSLKYAFPDNRKGEIWINIRQEEGRITMILGDNGTGVPADIDLTATKTLGMTLIQTLVIQQLSGEITLKREHGTEYIINFGRQARY